MTSKTRVAAASRSSSGRLMKDVEQLAKWTVTSWDQPSFLKPDKELNKLRTILL